MSLVGKRPMKYPYTIAAMVAQFPYKHHLKTNWIARYYLLGVLVSLPVFVWINGKVNSPQALENHKQMLKKQEAEKHHH